MMVSEKELGQKGLQIFGGDELGSVKFLGAGWTMRVRVENRWCTVKLN